MIEFGKNNQNEWQILKPRPLRADSGAVEGLIRKLKDAKMDLTTDRGRQESVRRGAREVAMATVSDAAGNQTLEVQRDKDKNVYAKGSAAEGAYKTPGRPGGRARQRPRRLPQQEGLRLRLQRPGQNRSQGRSRTPRPATSGCPAPNDGQRHGAEPDRQAARPRRRPSSPTRAAATPFSKPPSPRTAASGWRK